MTTRQLEKQARVSQAITREMRAIRPTREKLVLQLLRTKLSREQRAINERIADLEAEALARAYKLASAA